MVDFEKKGEKMSSHETDPDSSSDRSSISLKSILKSFGPGTITGSSDDDPSGIATYSQAGATFGFGMLWMALYQYPLMTVIQEICARIGLITGDGLAAVINKKYSKRDSFSYCQPTFDC